jgi:Flp pilus assembly protein TadG
MIMFTMLLPFILVPLVGLAIDATMLYSVKVKLQAAVDGGALAAAQALSAGQNDTAEKSAAYFAADQFIRGNIQTGATAGAGGYWGSFNFNDTNCAVDSNGNETPTGSGLSGGMTYSNALNTTRFSVSGPVNHVRTVAVVASVQVPLLFMRILGFSTGTVTSRGSASRRDVVMVMVIDRSGSEAAETDALKSGAEYFVNQFSEGHDQLGLVLMNGSSIVAYPSGDWGLNPPTTLGGGGGATGPDGNFKSTTLSPNMLTQIANFANNNGNTGMAEALMLAYYELLAANQTGALNAIVLWTDGQPNGISADFNNTLNNAVKANCKYWSGGTNSGLSATGAYPEATSNSLVGWFAQWGGYAASGSGNGDGIFVRSQTDTNISLSNWVALSGGASGNKPLLPNSAGATNCSFASNQNSGDVQNDINIPAQDYYGNSTLGSSTSPYTLTDYTQSYIWTSSQTTAGSNCNVTSNVSKNGQNGANQLQLTGNLPDGDIASGNACQVGLASWNAADMAGKKIHADTNITPRIYTMGYAGNVTGSGGVDTTLMQRLANVNTNNMAVNPLTNKVYNTVYNSAVPSAMYIQIQQTADVAPAFNQLLAQIVRLSR